MLEGAMLVWFILTGASIAFVIWDSVSNGVTSWVQRLAWLFVTIYTGPVGAFLYLLACRRPFPGGHDRYTAAAWKQGLNSEMHCLAGDATGIILAAAIVPLLGLANGWDLLIEYAVGFLSGLFIFQALMMVGMYGGDYFRAVRKTFFAETVSMNFVMAGMVPVMLLLGVAWPNSGHPVEPAFWFRMSLAVTVGGILAFPVNFWLVKGGLKHGCMTLPQADGPAPYLGHRSPEAAAPAVPAETHRHSAGANPSHSRTAHPHGPAAPENHHGLEQPGPPGASAGEAEHPMAMAELSFTASMLGIAATFLVLLAAVWFTSRWVHIGFG